MCFLKQNYIFFSERQQFSLFFFHQQQLLGLSPCLKIDAKNFVFALFLVSLSYKRYAYAIANN